MEQTVTILNPGELPTQFDMNELPNIVSGVMQELIDYGKEVDTSVALADKARESADYARSKPTGWFQKADAIEALQLFSCDSSKALSSQAKVQEISFKFQTRLAEITKYLFGLGVSNLALNRSVVRELELKLRDASTEELSDLARQETMNVIRQLKAQEDILVKQEKLDEKIKGVHDENVKISKQLKEQAEADKNRDEKLQTLGKVDARLAEELKAQAEVEIQHKEMIASLEKKTEELNQTLISLKNEVSSLFTDISKKLSKKITVAYVIGGIGVLIGIVAVLLTILT